MKSEFWIKISARKKFREWMANGHEVRKTKPTTGPNEVAIKMTVEIPDAYFETPELSAKVTVPADKIKSPVINADVASNIGEVLSQQLGLKVHVSAADPEQDNG